MIEVDKRSENPVYLQIANTIIREIKTGVIQPSTKMPGTRTLSEMLEVNRQTVVKAYEELYAQEWLISIHSKGTFVSRDLPIIHPRPIVKSEDPAEPFREAGFAFDRVANIHDPARPNRHIMGFHDGPDARLVPVEQIARGFKRVVQRKQKQSLLSYVDTEGRESVRESISEYLNTSRGLHTRYQNIMITRGSQMALFLLTQVLISEGDLVLSADIGYRYANLTFMHAGAKLVKVGQDDQGILVDQIEDICKKKKIRAIYITSHHQYPTTVTLCAGRRMRLLDLAVRYGFIIIEDDYDYEFHYESSPILPLASADAKGMVIYIGSFSKTLSPAIRVGYVSAPESLIKELARMRQIVDAQGDPIMEQVVGEMIDDGEIGRHMKKSLKEYRIRRDHMSNLLESELSDVIEFRKPEGGLAIWAKFDSRVKVPELAEKMLKQNVVLSRGLLHDLSAGRPLNSTRLGFGWMTLPEADHAVEVMKKSIG